MYIQKHPVTIAYICMLLLATVIPLLAASADIARREYHSHFR